MTLKGSHTHTQDALYLSNQNEKNPTPNKQLLHVNTWNTTPNITPEIQNWKPTVILEFFYIALLDERLDNDSYTRAETHRGLVIKVHWEGIKVLLSGFLCVVIVFNIHFCFTKGYRIRKQDFMLTCSVLQSTPGTAHNQRIISQLTSCLLSITQTRRILDKTF